MIFSIIKILQNLPWKGQRYLRMTKEQKLQVRFLTLHSRHISMMPLFAVWWDPTDQFLTTASMTAKTHQELLAKAKHNWPDLLLQEVASTFFSQCHKHWLSVQSPNQSACFAKLIEILFYLHRSQIWSGASHPRVHGLILFSSPSVPPWRSFLCHCLRTAVLFHLNVNELLQIWSAVPVSLLYDSNVI